MSQLQRQCAFCQEWKWRSAFRIGQGYSPYCRICRSWALEAKRLEERAAYARSRLATWRNKLRSVEKRRKEFEDERLRRLMRVDRAS